MQNTKYVIFNLDEEEYGLDIMVVNTIEKYISIEEVPNSPTNMKGIIHLRGDIIPVYSLRSKFGLSVREPDEDTRFIITKSNDILIAYEVDRMQNIAELEEAQINETPSILKSEEASFMKSVANNNNRLIIMLDPNGILTSEEQKQIKEIINLDK